jgi:hypothetical protein
MKRRSFLLAAAAAALAPQALAQKPMKIGIIGSGRIGSTIGGLWVKAGHEVMFSDRDAEQVKRAIEGLGPRARAGSVQEAAAFGDAILIAVPYMALPAIQQQAGAQLRGKVVIDPNNPVASRDGEMKRGTCSAHGARTNPPFAALAPPREAALLRTPSGGWPCSSRRTNARCRRSRTSSRGTR